MRVDETLASVMLGLAERTLLAAQEIVTLLSYSNEKDASCGKLRDEGDWEKSGLYGRALPSSPLQLDTLLEFCPTKPNLTYTDPLPSSYRTS